MWIRLQVQAVPRRLIRYSEWVMDVSGKCRFARAVVRSISLAVVADLHTLTHRHREASTTRLATTTTCGKHLTRPVGSAQGPHALLMGSDGQCGHACVSGVLPP